MMPLEIKDREGNMCYLGDVVIYLSYGDIHKGKIEKITPKGIRSGAHLSFSFYLRDPNADVNRENPDA